MTSMLKQTGARIALIYLLAVMAAMTVSEPVTELGRIAREFHPGSAFITGLVMSLPSLVVVLGALVSGYIVDQLGDRPVLFTGIFITILGDLGVILAPTLKLLLASRLVAGVGYVLAAIATITIMTRITSGKQRTMALALWSTTFPVSFIIPFLAAGLAEKQGSWRAAFADHAGLSALFVILAAFSLPKPDRNAVKPSRFAGLGAVLRSPWAYLLGLANASNALRLTGLMAVLGPYLASRYGVNEFGVQRMNVIAMAFGAIGGLLAGRLMNRGVPTHILGLVALVVSTGALFGIATPSIGYGASILASWLYAFTCGALMGMWALVPRCAPAPSSMGATSGIVTQMTLIGVLLGAPLASMATSTPKTAPLHIFNIVSAVVLVVTGLPVWRRGVTAHHSAPPTNQRAMEAK